MITGVILLIHGGIGLLGIRHKSYNINIAYTFIACIFLVFFICETVMIGIFKYGKCNFATGIVTCLITFLDILVTVFLCF